jgi:ankyrin repeat protein
MLLLLLSYPQTDPDRQGNDGNTALILAVQYNDPTAVQLLLEAGANPDVANDVGLTPLMWAVNRAPPNIVTLLLDYSADVNAQNNDGLTALAYASGTHSLPLLLNVNSIDLDIQDDQGQTALMRATVNGFTESVGLLLKAGADPLVKDNHGRIASQLTHNRVIKHILQDYEARYREDFDRAKDALFDKLLVASRLKGRLEERYIPENIFKQAEYDRLCVILQKNTKPDVQALASSLNIPLGNKTKSQLCAEILDKLKF